MDGKGLNWSFLTCYCETTTEKYDRQYEEDELSDDGAQMELDLL